jgi:predicted RNA binding protein YcfA (HicA-like mRNA interferase family)
VTTLRLHQLERLLAARGYVFLRQRGSHRHYADPSGRRVTLSIHGGEHSQVCWRQVAAVARDIDRLAGTEQEQSA